MTSIELKETRMSRYEDSYLLSSSSVQSVVSEYSTSPINTPDTIHHQERPYTQKPYVSTSQGSLRHSSEKNTRSSSSNIIIKLGKTKQRSSTSSHTDDDIQPKTAKHNIYAKKSIQNQQRKKAEHVQHHERSKSMPLPIRKIESKGVIHRDLTFNDLQTQLAKSLQIQDQLKQYVNNKIVSELEKGQLRITLLEFVRTQTSIENVDNYDDYIKKYDYVKVKTEPTVISIDQLSTDLKKYEEQYCYISQILIYLSSINPPLKVIIAKSEIEVGLKSIYQDECIADDDEDDENGTEREVNTQIAISNQHSSSSSNPSGSKLMIQCIDYLSELSPVKVKKIIYHYTMTIDLALSPPKQQRVRPKSAPK